MFSIYNLFNQTGIKTKTKESVTAWRSEDSNPYLYPAMKECLKAIRHNHGSIINPVDGSSLKVRALVETKNGEICAWLDKDREEEFALSKVNIIKGLPLVTEGVEFGAKNAGSIERSIRHYNDTHDHIIVSWIAY